MTQITLEAAAGGKTAADVAGGTASPAGHGPGASVPVEAPKRMSRQRREVLDNLHRHPVFRSAQDIHASLALDGSSTGLATVYRNLQVLEESGQVDAVRGASGEMLYRACEADAHHHHLICDRCGRAEEVELVGVEEILTDLARAHGYTLKDHTLELMGLCDQCGKVE